MRLVFILGVALLMASCDPARVFDDNKSVGNQWYYENRVPFEVQITDTQALYNVYVNLRVSADYKYSNIFMLLYTTNPENKVDRRRVEIRLANQAGKFLGAGLGDLYDYQFPVIQKSKLAVPGFYKFEIEQNMRDDTLMHVISTGIRVEKVAE